jgi:hypothetical protein
VVKVATLIKFENMKVSELIAILEKYDQDLDIYVPSKLTENDYCFVHSAKAKLLTIEESETEVLVLDEILYFG